MLRYTHVQQSHRTNNWFIVLTAVVSASTLVTYNMLKSEETESFFAKVDFAEGTNHYTLIEIDEGDNDEENL